MPWGLSATGSEYHVGIGFPGDDTMSASISAAFFGKYRSVISPSVVTECDRGGCSRPEPSEADIRHAMQTVATLVLVDHEVATILPWDDLRQGSYPELRLLILVGSSRLEPPRCSELGELGIAVLQEETWDDELIQWVAQFLAIPSLRLVSRALNADTFSEAIARVNPT